MIGMTVGSYEVTAGLAEGGMGTVYVARHAVMGREAVIKLLKPELSHDEEMVRRFFNEARAAASINDPGIVQVFDVGFLADHRAYIVMERLRGETLASRLRSRGMTLDQAVQILRLLARTLDAAHAHSIVHRDLKPDNIFLVPDRDVSGGERTKILDFGIAKLAGGGATQHTRAGTIFGTPAYMAPEQCADAGNVDARADLYALGCIAYEMLSGKPPFGYGGIELLASHLRDEPMPLRHANPGVPEWLAEVVHRLLRKQPAERYSSSAELHSALGAATMQPQQQVPPTMPPTYPPMGATQASVSPGRAPGILTPTPMPIVGPYTNPAQPSGYAPASAAPPMMTTHATASGMVGTQPPAARSKLPYLLAGLAIVAAAVVVVVVVTKQEDKQEPAKPTEVAKPPPPAAGNPLADAMEAARLEKWTDAIAAAAKVPAGPDEGRAKEITARAEREIANEAIFGAIKLAVDGKDLAVARAEFAKLSQDSTYLIRARELIEQAEAKVVAVDTKPRPADKKPPKDTKPKVDPKSQSTKPPDPKSKPDEPTRPPEPEGPSLGFDEAVKKAEDAIAGANYAVALASAKAALRARPGNGEARMLATIAACGVKNRGAAIAFLPPDARGMKGYRDAALSRCRALRVDLDIND